MDISVSQLNGRLALRLPPELPLGLVFVVGYVGLVEEDHFVLVEESHQLVCQSVEPVHLNSGDEIRASGHLMFDRKALQFFLLARDIEILTLEAAPAVDLHSRELLAESKDLLSALSAVKARAVVAPAAADENVPVWVQKLAPPEAQVNQPDASLAEEERGFRRTAVLDDELVAMLSAAMDSDDEMELTPELLAPYVPEVPDAPVPVESDEAKGGMGAETAVTHLTSSYRPANREDTDWLVILLIISFFILTIAAILAIVLV